MRILIIDDEISTRESIKILAGFCEELGDEIFEATNGLEGYRMIETVHPDIIFLDMNMPVVDGAELLDVLDKKDFSSRIIVVSGYTDFRYTKAAILRQYVVDYIQKPIDRDQIQAAVQKITGVGKRRSFVTGCEEENKGEMMCGLFTENFAQILKKNYNNSLELLQYFFIHQIEHQISEAQLYLPEHRVCHYALFFTCSQPEYGDFEMALERMVQELNSRYDINVYAVYGERKQGQQRYALYTEICQYLNYININGDRHVASLEDGRKINRPESDSAYWAGELVYYAEHQNREMFDRSREEVYRELIAQEQITIYEIKIFISDILYEVRKRMVDRVTGVENLISEKLTELYSGNDLFTTGFSRAWIEDFLEEIWRMTGNIYLEIPEKLKQIVYYIQKNYGRKITLTEVAEQFYFNASTISRMFVKYLGINYIDYVNTLRLEKARDLLDMKGISISETAERTGFDSLSYFSRQFKKKYGVSPQEYKKQIERDLYGGERER